MDKTVNRRERGGAEEILRGLRGLVMMLLAIGLFEGPLARAEERIGFESEEGFTVEGRLPGTVRTSGGAQAAVVSGVAAAGSQSLRLGGEGQVLIALGDGAAAPVIYGSFSLNGDPDPEREDNPTVSLGGAQIGFSASGGEGEIWIRHVGSGSSQWIDTGSRLSSGDDLWLRLTVRLDEPRGIWDLYEEGQLIAARIGLGAEGLANILTVTSRGPGPTLLDELLLSEQNPLFEDADGDGIDDAFERSVGADPASWDRDRVVGANGATLLESYLGHQAPPSDALDADESGGAVVSFERKHGARSNPLLKLYEEEMALEVFTPLRSERVTLTLEGSGRDRSE